MDFITSTHNEKIKRFIRLQKARERREENLIVVEGQRELELAIKAGLRVEQLLYCPDFIAADSRFAIIDRNNDDIISEYRGLAVLPGIFESLAFKQNPDGWLALVEPKPLALSNIKLSACPLVVILEAVEKPGNLGAVLRTAYAAGADAVIVADPLTDIYNPNAIRASLGHVFTNQLAAASFEDTVAWLRANDLQILSAALPGSVAYTEPDMTKPTALVFGTEADGLGERWLEEADLVVRIPMRPGIDSLNLSVSAGIMLYEARRQRG
jgi:TrmH family RNA methyltransferase